MNLVRVTSIHGSILETTCVSLNQKTYWIASHMLIIIGLDPQIVIGPASRKQAKRNEANRPYMRYETIAKSDTWDCALVQVQPTSSKS